MLAKGAIWLAGSGKFSPGNHRFSLLFFRSLDRFFEIFLGLHLFGEFEGKK